MPRQKYTYDENSSYGRIICNFTNLLNAYKKAHLSKRNDKRVIEFDKHYIRNLNRLLDLLKRKEWNKIFKYYRFTIYEPKERDVDALEFEGRIVQHVLCDLVLAPLLDKRLIKENCACRKNKGTMYASDILKDNLNHFIKRNEEGYCLKMDIKKYFPHIDRTILKEMLSPYFDDEMREFVFWIIDNCPEDNGLPIGNQTSQWFALFYLNKVDRIIKEKYSCKYYVRYMDDLIVIHKDKEYLKKMLNELNSYINNNLKLEFNEKTQIIPLHRGISFLGWKYTYNENNRIFKKIDSSKKKYRNKTIKLLNEEFNKGLIDVDEYNNRMRSYISYMKLGDTYNYRKRHNCKLKGE